MARQRGQRVGDHREHDHHVGAEERHVAVHGRDERAVRPLIHRRPGVGEAEQAGAERREDGAAERPVQRERVGMGEPRAADGLSRRRTAIARNTSGSSAEKKPPIGSQ